MSVKKITYGAVILALAILLPQILHFTGIPKAGQIFLPMHIPILMAGVFVGPFYGLAIGMLAPIISFLVSGMPSAVILPFMTIELAAYGFFSGIFYDKLSEKKMGILLYILFTQICGRIVLAAALLIATDFLSLSKLGISYLFTAITTGAIGIVLQIVIIPPIVKVLKKAKIGKNN